MPTSDPDLEPGTPPVASPRPDVDFDPEIDVAPAVRTPSDRPELAAALAGADDELQWVGDAKPSEQRSYVLPTTLPRGLVAPTLDMAAVRVRSDLDPRRAVTVPAGVLPRPAVLASAGDLAPSEVQPRHDGKQRPWGVVVAALVALLALVGLLVRVALKGPTDGPELAGVPSGTTTAAGTGATAIPLTADTAATGATAPGTAPASASGPNANPSGTALEPNVPLGSSAPPVTTGAAAPAGSATGATSVRPPPSSSGGPGVDAGAPPKAAGPSSASPSPSVAPPASVNVAVQPPQPSSAPSSSGPPAAGGSVKPVTPLFKIEKE